MLLTFERILKSAWQHILRNEKLSLASTLIMALTFFVSSIFLVSLYGASIVLNYFEHQSQIIVFFTPDNFSNAYKDKVASAVENLNIPVSVTYVSQSQAGKIFIDFLKQDSPTLSQEVDVSKLPPSLEIKTTNIDDLQKVATVLYNFQSTGSNIDKILYYKNVEDFLRQFINIVKLSALLFISFLGSISLLIIWITIGIALNSHADEIEIMQLVGATRSYIELPYIIEGAIYGILGSCFSFLLIGGLYFIVTRFYASSYIVFISYFKGIPTPTLGIGQIFLLLIGEMLLGAFVGGIGSFIAIRGKLR